MQVAEEDRCMSPNSPFTGCLPALMTPVGADGEADIDQLVATGTRLCGAGMDGVVYCGSMGEWPLVSDATRRDGVAALVDAGISVVVGTGAVSPQTAVDLAAHAAAVGAAGLMVIPRVLSRSASPRAQASHFARVLDVAEGVPAVIYNSPYYGFETRAELFFELRERHSNLVGYKEFGGAAALSYAAEHITSADPGLSLVVGVDTRVVHGLVNCGASGVISGVGNVLPEPVLELVKLSRAAAAGDGVAHEQALALERAIAPLATFDEGPDLVLYYKLLDSLVANEADRARPVDGADQLSASQIAYATRQLERFEAWWTARRGVQ